MSKLRVVFDTNVFISAFLFEGKPKEATDTAASKKVIAVISLTILQELREKLLLKFHLPSEKVDEFIDTILEFSEVFPVTDSLHDISRDPKDHPVLETAVAGRAQVIVTGDKDLLVLKRYENVEILTPGEFLKKVS